MIDTGLHLHWTPKRVARFKGYIFWVDAFTTWDNDTVRYDWHMHNSSNYFATCRSPDEKPYDTERAAKFACEFWIARNLGSW